MPEPHAARVSMDEVANFYIEYGKTQEGYLTYERFMKQMCHAVKIADMKQPKDEGYFVC